MASTHKHIRSSTASKRPTTAIADGQIALNTNAASAGLFFKDSTGATIIKVGPVHVGTTAPNATPAAGGSSGNSTGEVWLDTSLTPVGVKIWNGSAWVNATPIGSTTVQGLLELATNAETQAGADTARAVTPAGLQSKVSDSVSTTSSTTIASSTAVKTAYDLANAALPKAGGTVTGNLEIGTTGSLTFEGATADAFETTLAVADPTADRTITLPDVSGTVVTTGDTGTVTSTMIADGTIVDADINASAAIGLSKLATGALPTGITVASANIVDGTIVDADISASAEIAVSKLADGAARQLLQTDAAGTGVEWTDNVDIPGTFDVTGAATFDSSATVVGDLTVDTDTLYVDSTNNRVGIGTTSPQQLLELSNSSNIRQVIRNTTENTSYACSLDFVTGSGSLGSANVVARVAGLITSANPSALAGALQFQVNRGDDVQEAARIDGSGRLLVGTSSTSQQLSLLVQGSSGGGTSGVVRTAFTGATPAADVALGSFDFADSGHTPAARIIARRDGGTWTSGASQPTRLEFSTTANGASSPTERMRIDSSGTVSINATTQIAAEKLLVVNTAGQSAIFKRGETTGTVESVRFVDGNNNDCGSIDVNTTANTTAYTTSSDYRLKQNVVPLQGCIARLNALKPCEWNWISSPETRGEGFLAHEAAEVVPECVTGTKDEVDADGNPVYQGIDQSKLVPLLTAALQEVIGEIESLKARVAALESA